MAIVCGWPHFHKKVAFISYKARTDFHEFDPFSTSNSPTMAHNSKGSDEKSPEEQAPQAAPAPSEGPTSQDASAASQGSTPPSSRKDLGLEQKKDIILKIHNHTDNTLASAIPEGFHLTFGDVKAIVEELKADAELSRICQQILQSMTMLPAMFHNLSLTLFLDFRTWEQNWKVIKDEDSWVAGQPLILDSTEWKGYGEFQNKQRVILLSNLTATLHDAMNNKLEDITDVEQAIPANYQLTKAEILEVLKPGNWPDQDTAQEAGKASQALEDLFKEINQSENELIRSACDDDENDIVPQPREEAIRQVLRSIDGTNKDTYVDAIEGNLAPGATLSLQTLIKILLSKGPEEPYDTRLRQKAKTGTTPDSTLKKQTYHI
jgi:hypothetical protein